ncbi:MAG: AAA family ATPase [Saprospiraceae bacterium]
MAKNTKKAPRLEVENLGQIRSGAVEFGDLTLLVGGQASGKSIFLQLLKLLIDRFQVFDTLQKHGFDWGNAPEKMLELYFGESMSAIWNEQTAVIWNKKSYPLKTLAGRKGAGIAGTEENLFYIPAQRVVTMAQGFPRPFNSFDVGDPYILKSFSEVLRLLMEKESPNGGGGGASAIFPRPGRIKEPIRKMVDSGIFHGASVELDKATLKKRFLLRVGGSSLPFMTWSAGQKEFMPLLLSLYHLIPPSKVSKRDAIEWVVLEEPEMGLHPQAIQTVMLLCLELISRGYRVAISTHSPVLLELVWVINRVKSSGGEAGSLFELFGFPKKDQSLKEVFQTCIGEKTFRTYHFNRKDDGIHIQDISGLDPGSDNPTEANWGGLSEFASRAGEVVSKLPKK